MGLAGAYIALWGPTITPPSSPEELLQPSSRCEGYPHTYYTHTVAEQVTDHPPLKKGEHSADVCVVGGGLSGLATAIGLAERGKKVILIEDKRIGWSASGMNGGFAVAGFQVGLQL